MTSIRPAIEELERGFVAFAPLFGRPMPQPVITVQSKGRKRMAGWFGPERWQNGQPGFVPEINICAEHLARPVEDIAEVLVHEMCHYADALDGIRDCSHNQYHNKHFKVRCESVGLICERHPSRGWASTRLSDALKVRVAEVALDPEAFSLFRRSPAEKRVVGTRLKGWKCGCTSIWSKTEVEAVCEQCGKSFAGGSARPSSPP